MRVLVIGSGGREHAMCWALAKGPEVQAIYAAPGNPGMAELGRTFPVRVDDVAGIVRCADELAPDLVVIGPETPLALGVVDALMAAGHRAFGPSAAASRIESSKAFAKAVMDRAGVPTAGYQVFDNADAARAAALEWGGPLVVKLDGLAAGKGVIVADSPEGGAQAVDELAAGAVAAGAATGASGATADGGQPRFILEERLSGYEVSVFAVSDGLNIRMLIPAQDHKRAFDGDVGPNTGGMGAVAPVPSLTAKQLHEVADTIMAPIIGQLADEGSPFTGVLFAGLMMTEHGPKVLEFNCRLGDPETQAVLPLLRTPFVEVVDAACQPGGLTGAAEIEFEPAAAACVVMAAPGYPGRVTSGQEITLPSRAALGDDATVFHAGTAMKYGKLVAAGGRVVAVTSVGSDLAAARRRAYEVVEQIKFDGAHYRRDIGARADARG
ncbi:MAG: Phosphoribosylamine--glycine ligase [Firmicutes bacterium ADurb.Bin506]|nr:MAG: Phosphoribosylamine--glycine ligase [Firmicutes bacterium ADurb.Bin506]